MFKPFFIKYILFAISLLIVEATFAQIDSLKIALKESQDDSIKVNILIQISKESDFDMAIEYAEKAIALAEKSNIKIALAYAHKQLGMPYFIQGDYSNTYETWQKSLEIFEEVNYELGIGNMLGNLGVVYYNVSDNINALDYYLRALKIAERVKDELRMGTLAANIGVIYAEDSLSYDKALQYYAEAIEINQRIGYKEGLATSYLNTGEVFMYKRDYEKALFFFTKADSIFEIYPDSHYLPYLLTFIGKTHAAQGNYQLAIDFQKRAIVEAKKFDANLELVQSMVGLGDTYFKKKDLDEAEKIFEEAEKLAIELGSDEELREIYSGLASTNNELSQYQNAFKYQALLTDINSKLYNVDNSKRLESLQFNFDIEKKESEIGLLTKERELQDSVLQRQRLAQIALGIGLVLVFFIAFMLFRNIRFKAKAKAQIEDLLRNILPREISKELQENGYAKPQYYESVTVLFTDFVGFSKMAEDMSPQVLISVLDQYFKAFDDIIERAGLEKIKTIGDSYMCACGIPVENKVHAVKTVYAGLELQKYVARENVKRKANGELMWDIRIGIHTGPVVAGVVGKVKFAYDIWGNTVNVASRMESTGEAGRVNISSTTYEQVKDKFNCVHRGKIKAKNIEEIDMYFVKEAKSIETSIPITLK